ncbi:hypothetical protein ACH4FX_30830 [Streptomyces sp. NPDC018019]|uniref:hypothetical protein n=1 Tax=Streptomyces sp. NPDC018019 TaxID=3365030 RepID=UPI0037A398F4
MLDVLHRDRLALRIHDGAFSAMDLTVRHPRAGELLSTVKFTVQSLAAGELQRGPTYDGLRAAEARGSKGRRRPAVHRRLLACCQPLDGAQGVPVIPAQRKARREYENRVSALASGAP